MSPNQMFALREKHSVKEKKLWDPLNICIWLSRIQAKTEAKLGNNKERFFQVSDHLLECRASLYSRISGHVAL